MAKLLSKPSYPFKGHVNKFYRAKKRRKIIPVSLQLNEKKSPIPVAEKWQTFYRHQYAPNKKYTLLEQY